jgi:hypothetical protein
LYCTIRSCTIRIVQYKIVFDSKGLEQDMKEKKCENLLFIFNKSVHSCKRLNF